MAGFLFVPLQSEILFLGGSALLIHTGHQLRVERKRLSLPMRTLEALADVSVAQICSYEYGSRISQAALDRIGEALERVERVRLALLPARLDMRDAAALREALQAYERGDAPWFVAHSKPAENPVAITF